MLGEIAKVVRNAAGRAESSAGELERIATEGNLHDHVNKLLELGFLPQNGEAGSYLVKPMVNAQFNDAAAKAISGLVNHKEYGMPVDFSFNGKQTMFTQGTRPLDVHAALGFMPDKAMGAMDNLTGLGLRVDRGEGTFGWQVRPLAHIPFDQKSLPNAVPNFSTLAEFGNGEVSIGTKISVPKGSTADDIFANLKTKIDWKTV
jgi:hypothetical protein